MCKETATRRGGTMYKESIELSWERKIRGYTYKRDLSTTWDDLQGIAQRDIKLLLTDVHNKLGLEFPFPIVNDDEAFVTTDPGLIAVLRVTVVTGSLGSNTTAVAELMHKWIKYCKEN